MPGFNTYGNVQLQIVPHDFHQYQLGDQVPLADGIYCGHDGFIVIVDGKFVLETQTMQSTQGATLFPETCMRGLLPWLPGSGKEEG